MGVGYQKQIDVTVQDQFSEEINIYMHIDKLETTLSAATVIDGKQVTLESVTGALVGDAITIYNGDRKFQSLINSIDGTTITIASPMDHVFDAGDKAIIGNTNLAVDGSTTPVIAHFLTPENVSFDLYTISLFITDGAVMDSAKFGGISALTNGLVLRQKNGCKKNLALIYSNQGFSQQGWELRYDDKAPAGVYGLQARKNYKENSGVSLRTVGSACEEIEIIIQDDLTDLTSLTAIIQGHKVE